MPKDAKEKRGADGRMGVRPGRHERLRNSALYGRLNVARDAKATSCSPKACKLGKQACSAK